RTEHAHLPARRGGRVGDAPRAPRVADPRGCGDPDRWSAAELAARALSDVRRARPARGREPRRQSADDPPLRSPPRPGARSGSVSRGRLDAMLRCPDCGTAAAGCRHGDTRWHGLRDLRPADRRVADSAATSAACRAYDAGGPWLAAALGTDETPAPARLTARTGEPRVRQ